MKAIKISVLAVSILILTPKHFWPLPCVSDWFFNHEITRIQLDAL